MDCSVPGESPRELLIVLAPYRRHFRVPVWSRRELFEKRCYSCPMGGEPWKMSNRPAPLADRYAQFPGKRKWKDSGNASQYFPRKRKGGVLSSCSFSGGMTAEEKQITAKGALAFCLPDWVFPYIAFPLFSWVFPAPPYLFWRGEERNGGNFFCFLLWVSSRADKVGLLETNFRRVDSPSDLFITAGGYPRGSMKFGSDVWGPPI